MNKKLRITFIVFFIIIIAFCIGWIIKIQLDYKKGDKIYNDALDSFVDYSEETYHSPEKNNDTEENQGDESSGEVFPEFLVDFDDLQKINPDIIGWIWIPDTIINFPLIQGTDNSKYLKTTYNGEYSKYGSIFLDYRNNVDLTDANTIIYGHNMRNNAMFGTLSNFEDLEFAEEHTDLYIFTPDKAYRYEIFSAYTANTSGYPYVIQFEQPSGQEAFLKYITDASVSLKLDKELTLEDKVITLSTCLNTSSRAKRFVIHGVLMASSS